MATANTSDIAASQKDAQRDEAAKRGEVDRMPAQQADDGQVERGQARDTSGESQQQEPVIVDAPPPRSITSRDEIYKRFSGNRQAEADDVEGVRASDPPPFLAKDTPGAEAYEGEDEGEGQGEGQQIRPAAQEPASKDQPQKIKLKVRGNSFDVTHDQLVKMAGLTAEEAEGVPVPSLVRAAQLVEANKSYLDEAKEMSRNARVRRATQADDDDEQDTRRTDPPAPQKPTLEDAIQKTQFETPEDAAPLWRDVIADEVESRLRTRDQQNAQRSDQNRVLNAERDFKEKNPEFKEPAVDAVHTTYFLEEALGELLDKTGSLISAEQAQFLRQNPDQLAAAYKLAMPEFGLRSVETLMDEAGTKTRQRLNIPRSADPSSQQQQDDPPRQQQPPARRVDLKRRLATTPARSGGQEAEQQQQPAPQRKPSDIIKQMRIGRGQPVA